MLGMGKKKPPGGKHTTPRHAVQLPKDWYAVVQAMAADSKMLATWFLIDMIREAAQARGRTDLPPVPWEPLPPPPGAAPKRRGK